MENWLAGFRSFATRGAYRGNGGFIVIMGMLLHWADLCRAMGPLPGRKGRRRRTRFDVPCAPVLSVAEATQHPHLRERGTVQAIDDPLHGHVDIPAIPIKWGTLPNNLPLDAPTLGQHNESVLTEKLGRSSEEVEALRAAGVLIEREI